MTSGRRTLRWRTHQILESGLGHDTFAIAANVGLLLVIVLDVLGIIAATVPSFEADHRAALRVMAAVAGVAFASEYVLRLWAALELPFLSRMRPAAARRAYAMRPMAVIDLAAALTAIAALALPETSALHVLRLVAFLKVARYSSGLQSLGHVVLEERSTLFGAFLVMLCLLLFAGSGIWLIESSVQPDRFGTLPDTLWWAMITLATVGYGDVVPVTPLGKMFTVLMILSGVGVFAIPVGIIVTGFAQVVARRDFMVTWALVARVPVFAGLDASAIADIMDLLHSHTYEPGEEVVRGGESADTMYFIAQGEVIVGIPTGDLRLGVGEFFGEMAMLEGRAHRHDVTAVSHCRLLVLRREDFNRLGRLYPEMLARVRETAEQRRASGDARRVG